MNDHYTADDLFDILDRLAGIDKIEMLDDDDLDDVEPIPLKPETIECVLEKVRTDRS